MRVAGAQRGRTERRTARSRTLAGRAARGAGNSSATARMSRIGAAAFGVSAMSATARTAASPTAITAPRATHEDSRRRRCDDAPGAVVAGAGIGGVATATDVRLVARSSPTKACMACSCSCWRPTGSARTRLPLGLALSRPDSAPTMAARAARGRCAAGVRGPIGSVVTHGRRHNAHHPPRAAATWRKRAHELRRAHPPWIRPVSASQLLHGCRSATGSDRGPADARSSSAAVAWSSVVWPRKFKCWK